MDAKTLKKGCWIAVVTYLVIVVLLYWIGGEQFHYQTNTSTAVTPSTVVGEITSDVILEQRLSVQGDELQAIQFTCATYQRNNTGTLCIELLNADKIVLVSRDVDVSQLQDNTPFSIVFSDPVPVPDGGIFLRITAPDATLNNCVTLYMGNTMSATRTEVDVSIDQTDMLLRNGTNTGMVLSTSLTTGSHLWFGDYYFYFAAAVLLCLVAICGYLVYCNKKQKPFVLLTLLSALKRYNYLMKQLVSRDFKTKYKRSVLGVCWSFLNPLLTMGVQYVVFSTLFKSDIPNFPLYLLTGIVCFNFFNEATTMSLVSIVGNASLITKVYMPKYIYPLTRVMSSTVNFLLAFIPLFAVMLVTRAPISPALLLLPFGILCLFCAALGVGMLLSAAMVFFRDTQFLWGVVSMIWMYLTPIFYPESIIPAQFLSLYRLNPLYQIITFIRTILIEGVSPAPASYGALILAATIPLLIGVAVFKKTQDKFILNL